MQSYLDLLIWWHWVITHPQSFLDLLPLPSLDMLSNPTSLILSDQRTKNVLCSLRNCGTQSRFLGLVLWTCLSTKPVFQFHFCHCEKAPWEKGNLRKKGVHFSSQFQVPVHHYEGNQGRNFKQLVTVYLGSSAGRNECMQAGSFVLSLLSVVSDRSRAPAWEWGHPRWGGVSHINSLDQYNPQQRSRHYNTT